MSSTMFHGESGRETIRRWHDAFRERLQLRLEDMDVATSFGVTHVTSTGPVDAPPLVVLHGALASSAHVLPELGSLTSKRRIHAVDIVGQSVMSEDRRIPLDDDSYGRWTMEVATGLGLDRFDLLGVSWGGFVATRAARVAPERLRHLVMLVPAGIVAGSAWRGFREMGWPMLKYRLFPSQARLDAVLHPLFSSRDPDWTAYFGDALRCYRMDMRIPPLAKNDDLRDVRCPTLVFGAENDLSFPGEELIARAKALFPNVEVELLADTKHCPPFTEVFRERLASRVETFLMT